MKTLLGFTPTPSPHWVGDGFPVRSLFSYDSLGRHASPFLLLDHAGPVDFTPAAKPRGVGEHPHRGFETVTIVYAGEVAHRDSTGRGGTIGPGDVQWMTAGRGILHEEFHSPDFTAKGGPLEMAQLWVNLPARAKMTEPGYQAITDAQIPRVPLKGDAGELRVIAGEFEGAKGPASTHSPLVVWDVALRANARITLPVPDGWSLLVALLKGAVSVNGTQGGSSQIAVLSGEGSDVTLEAGAEDARLLVLAGLPIDEPLVGYGPFVMNTRDEIRQAIDDFNGGAFGRMSGGTNA
ncbi:MAG: pirin family protein [Steroidobacteraceae bacterium]